MKDVDIGAEHWLRTRPIAHRGLCAPGLFENSMPAFRQCVANGRPIELDVHIMEDDEVVVFHDDTLLRTTGVHGDIARMRKSALRSLNLGQQGHVIPLLSEVLEEIAGRVPLLIELKTQHFNGRLERQVIMLLQHYKGEVALQSFHPRSVFEMCRRLPYVPCGLLSYDYLDSDLPNHQKLLLRHAPFLPLLAPNFVALEWSYLQSPLAKMAHLLGLPLLAWTVRSEQAKQACAGRCDNIIYEYPVVP